jgi:hypothetical protein
MIIEVRTEKASDLAAIHELHERADHHRREAHRRGPLTGADRITVFMLLILDEAKMQGVSGLAKYRDEFSIFT